MIASFAWFKHGGFRKQSNRLIDLVALECFCPHPKASLCATVAWMILIFKVGVSGRFRACGGFPGTFGRACLIVCISLFCVTQNFVCLGHSRERRLDSGAQLRTTLMKSIRVKAAREGVIGVFNLGGA